MLRLEVFALSSEAESGSCHSYIQDGLDYYNFSTGVNCVSQSTSMSSSPRPRGRRPHTKSRNGCARCKRLRRKVSQRPCLGSQAFDILIIKYSAMSVSLDARDVPTWTRTASTQMRMVILSQGLVLDQEFRTVQFLLKLKISVRQVSVHKFRGQCHESPRQHPVHLWFKPPTSALSSQAMEIK